MKMKQASPVEGKKMFHTSQHNMLAKCFDLDIPLKFIVLTLTKEQRLSILRSLFVAIY